VSRDRAFRTEHGGDVRLYLRDRAGTSAKTDGGRIVSPRSLGSTEHHGARQMASIFVISFPVRFQLGPEIA